MVLAVLVSSVVAAAPVSIAAPDLSGIDIDPKRLSFYTELYAQQLALSGIKVTTAKQIAAVLGLEQQKQLLGCTNDSTACMAELASALGADGIVSGTVARVGGSYQLSINILSGKDATPLSIFSARVDREEALLDELQRAGRTMGPEVITKLRPSETPVTSVSAAETPSGGLRQKAWIPAVSGVVFAGVGGALYLMSSDALNQLQTAQLDPLKANSLRENGKTERGLAYAGFGIGAAALIGAGVMYLAGAPAEGAHASVFVTPNGGAATVSGSF